MEKYLYHWALFRRVLQINHFLFLQNINRMCPIFVIIFVVKINIVQPLKHCVLFENVYNYFDLIVLFCLK